MNKSLTSAVRNPIPDIDQFESNFPPRYSSRPPHIHLKVTAPGFRTLVTQHYPQEGQTRGTFDLVLIPAE